jgi:hypothetical protein
VLIRQTAPVLGAANPYGTTGEWQVSLSFRGLNSDDHYRLDQLQEERHTLGTFVINRQRAADLNVSYTASPRLSLSVGIPAVVASWSIPSPTRPVPGPRAQQDARGLGDISAMARYWIFAPAAHTRRNLAIGIGVKAPTGADDVEDRIPDANGQNVALRTVDQSIQPGDGGWGMILEAQAFTQLRRVRLFTSGTYLANPRNTNGVPSLIVARGAAANPANRDKLVNSVPDQYVVRAGGAVHLWRGLGASGAWRVEGLPRYDVLGKSNGFRRPGVAMFVEPGVIYSHGPHYWSFNVPIGYYYNRKPDPNTGIEGDATFPRHIFLGTYGFRFGGRKGPPAPQSSR